MGAIRQVDTCQTEQTGTQRAPYGEESYITDGKAVRVRVWGKADEYLCKCTSLSLSSTAGSPIALAGRASCAAAVALVAAATRNVSDIPHPHRWTLLSACLQESTRLALDVLSSGKAVGRPGRQVGLSLAGARV